MKQPKAAASDPALADLAQAIVRRRQARELTQEEAAHRADVSLRHYQNLESGRLNPSFLTLKAVAAALGTTLADLLGSP